MEDYKELIKKSLEALSYAEQINPNTFYLTRADLKIIADAIERLIEEKNVLELQNHLERCEHENTRKKLDMAIRELENKSSCYTCANDEYCHGIKSNEPDICCGNYKWRGVSE